MKRILFILFAISFGLSCKKDNSVPKKAFEDIMYQDIESLVNDFPFEEVKVSTTKDGYLLKPGSILLFSLNTGEIGKLKIVGISAENTLTIDIVSYSFGFNPGNIYKDVKGATLQATYSLDLETVQQTLDASKKDLFWAIGSSEDRSILPYPGCRLYVYLRK